MCGVLTAAGLELTVHLEVSHKEMIESGELLVSADLLLEDGTVLLQDLPLKLQQVNMVGQGQGSESEFGIQGWVRTGKPP